VYGHRQVPVYPLLFGDCGYALDFSLSTQTETAILNRVIFGMVGEPNAVRRMAGYGLSASAATPGRQVPGLADQHVEVPGSHPESACCNEESVWTTFTCCLRRGSHPLQEARCSTRKAKRFEQRRDETTLFVETVLPLAF
jgi:hypothetical protein